MKTNPKHWLDIVFWPILKVLWEPFSKKRSHWWHWVNFNQTEIEYPLLAKGYPDAKSRETAAQNLIQTNFAWKHVLVLKPNTNDPDEEYQIGFWDAKTKVCQKCSIVLTGLTAVLVGPNDVSFFAVSPDNGKFLELTLVGELSKKELKAVRLI